MAVDAPTRRRARRRSGAGARPGKLVFVGHGAERTGPPIGLLHLLRWIRANTELDFEVLLLEGGPLLPEYRRLAPVWVLGEAEATGGLLALAARCERAGAARLGRQVRRAALRRRLRQVGEVAVLYVNTAWCIRAVRYLRARRATVITAVHELEVGLDHHLDADHRRLLVERTDRFVVVSDAVRRNLVDRHQVAEERTALHHEMVAGAAPRPAGEPRDELVVGASGLLRWRKGPDLFLLLARLVAQRRPDLAVRWVWIGGRGDGPGLASIERDRRAARLDDRVELAGEARRPLDRFRELDVFVLTSREDAYPLVCLEAASVGVPVVCFDTGGAQELVSGQVEAMVPGAEPPGPGGAGPCGHTVPYPDLEAMADRVVELLEDPAEGRRLGAVGADRVRRLHAVDVAAPRLVADLQPWLDPEPERARR